MWVAAFITFILGLGFFGSILGSSTPRDRRALIATCLIATLPMSWAMFYGLRLPLDECLKSILGEGETLSWLRTAYAPFTEEPAKLWPLALPWVRRAVNRENLGLFALALGLGFALGEIFTVANLIIFHQPEIASMHWYNLGGFISERLGTCLIHSAMTAIALTMWRRRSNFTLGLLLAMASHYLVNFPIAMGRWGWLGTNQTVSMAVLGAWVSLCFLCSLIALCWLHFGRLGGGGFFYGDAICPECSQRYQRPFFRALNFGPIRYEPCPHCRKWHWISFKNLVPKT